MSLPNYHHLLYFREIAKHGSVSKASEKLRIGQPSLSFQLKQLEDFFGTKLFTRANKKMVLTETGILALHYADKIYGLGKELGHLMNDKSLNQKSLFALGALDCIPKSIVYQISKKILDLGDHFLSIKEGNGPTMVKDLNLFHLDAFITNNLMELGSTSENQFNALSLFKLPISIYGNSNFEFLKENFPESLSNVPFLLPTHDSKIRSDLEHFFQIHSIHPKYICEIQDTSIMKLYAGDGLGVFPIADLPHGQPFKENHLIKIGTLDTIFEEYFFVTLKRDIESPLLQKFHKMIKKREINFNPSL